MLSKSKKRIPLSGAAAGSIMYCIANPLVVVIEFVLFVMSCSLVIGLGNFELFLVWLKLVAVYGLIRTLIAIRKIRRIKEQNRVDYKRGEAVIELFRSLGQGQASIAETAVINPEGRWRPVKSEVYTVNDLRMSMKGNIQMTGLLVYSGTFSGTGKGQSQPMLDDMPLVIWLEDENGETLRLIVPSRHMIVQMMADFCKQFSPNLVDYSHVWSLLVEQQNRDQLIGFVDWQRLMPARNVVDRLLLACDKPDEEKLTVRVKGRNFGTGVLLTAVAIDDEPEQIVLGSKQLDRFSELSGILEAPERHLLPTTVQ